MQYEIKKMRKKSNTPAIIIGLVIAALACAWIYTAIMLIDARQENKRCNETLELFDGIKT